MVVAVVLRPPCGPTPGGTLHSETILRNKLTSLYLEKKHCYLYYYDHYGHSASCLPSRYLAKDVKIGPHNDGLYCAQLAQTSIRVSRRRPIQQATIIGQQGID